MTMKNKLCKKCYKEFDTTFETLEVSPYNAAEQYYNDAWNSAVNIMYYKLKEEFEKTDNTLAITILDKISKELR